MMSKQIKPEEWYIKKWFLGSRKEIITFNETTIAKLLAADEVTIITAIK